MYPKLFTACLEGVFKILYGGSFGNKITGQRRKKFGFTDDIVLASDFEEDLQRMTEELHKESANVDLKMAKQQRVCSIIS